MNRHERRAQAAAARHPEPIRPELARANARIAALVHGVHKQVEDHHERGDAKDPELAALITCKRGCEYAAEGCCTMLVATELSEAQYIVDREPAAVKRALPRLLEQNRTMLEKLGPHNVISMMRDSSAEQEGAEAYWSLRMPCAFLDLTTNECTIHAHRPLGCRTYFVADEPHGCAMPPPHTVRLIDKGTRKNWPALLCETVHPPGLTTIVVGALPQLVLYALGHPDVKPVER